ncbi:LysR substrate-binding domain-containing protein [Paraburkholderia sp. EG285A]|uniref:LysR family transcriptional regulator n=1 Tax=Paraburkholderia sp. EG285A TaxID=3237009 RepID=UPI0034D206F1
MNSTDHGNLKRLAYFAAVVETGSFTKAAEQLGITKAVVSQQVARLEREFQTTLLTRTTRRVHPTDAGAAFYGRCATIIREAREAFAELSHAAMEPAGTLRMTAPFDYGVSVLVPAIAAFIERYPRCKVDVKLTDQTLDFVDSDIELAIRGGKLLDLNHQARQIDRYRQLLVAASSWKKKLPRAAAPHEIAHAPFVANTALRESLKWEFTDSAGSRQTVTFQSAVHFDATLAVKEAVCSGLGISVLPDFSIKDDLANGRLIQVLPMWSLPAGTMHAVFPAGKFRPAKIRAFVDLLLERQKCA